MDSWDNFKEQAKPKEEKPKPPSIDGWAKQFSERLKGKWFVFIHPKAGKVAGLCIAAQFSGYSEPGHIPDFSITLLGRSKTRRNEITVSLVDSRAQSFDTEEQAVAECQIKTS